MADPKDDEKFTPDEAGKITSQPVPDAGTERVEYGYRYPTRIVRDTIANQTRAGTDLSPSRGTGTGRGYVGPFLVDENGDITQKQGYDANDVGYEFAYLTNRPNELESFRRFLAEYTPYYGNNKPGTGMMKTTDDDRAFGAFFDAAMMNGKTWKAYMLDVMRGAKPNYAGTGGTGKRISVTAPEDISRQYLDASYRILGRAATQQEMQAAISWIQNQERQRAAGGSVDPMSLATAAQTRAGMAAPGEAVAQKVGMAMNELMNMLGGG